MTNAVHFSSAASEWETPPALFARLNALFNFTLDVCATKETAKCERFYSPSDNALIRSWAGEKCFMNPPYARGDKGARPWVKKAAEEAEAGTFVVALLPARTDTRWWHEYVEGKAHVIFLPGRVKFLLDGKEQAGAPFPSAIAIYWPRWL